MNIMIKATNTPHLVIDVTSFPDLLQPYIVEYSTQAIDNVECAINVDQLTLMIIHKQSKQYID